MRDDKYGGVGPFKVLKGRSKSLSWIEKIIGSQWGERGKRHSTAKVLRTMNNVGGRNPNIISEVLGWQGAGPGNKTGVQGDKESKQGTTTSRNNLPVAEAEKQLKGTYQPDLAMKSIES